MSKPFDPSDGRIVIRRDGRVFLIGLDRPKKLNGFSAVMLDGLAAAFTAFENDPDARSAVLYAEGPHFTAGLQLDQVGSRFAEGRPLFPAGEVDPVDLRAPLRSKPVVAAVQGICFTLGIELMLAADIVVAADDCRFAQLEVKRGIMANQGASIRMAERAGLGNALRYLLTGDEFDASTALRLGFVQEVVPAGRQLERALEFARAIAAQAPLAVAASRANARRALVEGPAAAIAEFEPVQARLMASEDAAEGVRSFVERRAAVFTGR
jgi:enoyl-CoA hydratase